MKWRQYLRIRTTDPAFLCRMVLSILVVGAAVGIVVQYLPRPALTDPSDEIAAAVASGATTRAVNRFEALLADRDAPFEEVLAALAALRPRPAASTPGELFSLLAAAQVDPQAVEERLASSSLSNSHQEIAAELWASLPGSEPARELSERAAREPPVRFANHALGVYWESRQEGRQAAAAYEREGQLADADLARRRAVQLYARLGVADALRRCVADPLYADAIPAYVSIELAAQQRDWWPVWWLVPRNEWERFSLPPAMLAAFAGLCWFVFALQAGQVYLPRGARAWLCVVAVLAGMLSIWPTHFLISWQEVAWGLNEQGDLRGGILYFVLGVGLREEFSKLLLLLPLLPLVARRGNELEALIVSACVGLGFAIVENEHYFASTFGSSSLGRFLTANFFHMAATGLIGLAVVRGVLQPARRGPEAIAVFGVIVITHGLYDAAIAIPALADYSIAAPIIFILLAYQFFHELRDLRTERTETVSLTATFLGGVSLLIAVTFVYLSAQLGSRTAFDRLVPEVLSMGLMAYMFLREMPNSLVVR